jgi:hypothetical protein
LRVRRCSEVVRTSSAIAVRVRARRAPASLPTEITGMRTPGSPSVPPNGRSASRSTMTSAPAPGALRGERLDAERARAAREDRDVGAAQPAELARVAAAAVERASTAGEPARAREPQDARVAASQRADPRPAALLEEREAHGLEAHPPARRAQLPGQVVGGPAVARRARRAVAPLRSAMAWKACRCSRTPGGVDRRRRGLGLARPGAAVRVGLAAAGDRGGEDDGGRGDPAPHRCSAPRRAPRGGFWQLSQA